MKESLLAFGLIGLLVGMVVLRGARETFVQYEQKCPDGSKPRSRMTASDKPPEFYCSSGVAEKTCPASHPFPYKDRFDDTRCESADGARDGDRPVCPAGSTEVFNEQVEKWQCEKITPVRCSDGGTLMITLMPGKGFGQKDGIDKLLCLPPNMSYDPTPEDIEKVRATNPVDITKLCKKPEDRLALDITAMKYKCLPPLVAPPPAATPPAAQPVGATGQFVTQAELDAQLTRVQREINASAINAAVVTGANANTSSQSESLIQPYSGMDAIVAGFPSNAEVAKALDNVNQSLKPMRPPVSPGSDIESERKAILSFTNRDMFFIQIALFLAVLSMLGYIVLPTEYAHGVALLFLTVAISFGFFLRR